MEFTDVEKRLLQELAEQGPLTGYEIYKQKRIMSNAYWKKVRINLSKNKMIKTVETKNTARGQKPFWLTQQGIRESLLLGYNPIKIKTNAKNHYKGKKLEAINKLCDFTKLAGKDVLKFVYDKNSSDTPVLELDNARIRKAEEGVSSFVEEYPEYKDPLLNALDSWKKKLLG